MQNEITQLQQQLEQVSKAIAAQEGLRGLVPDAQVDAMQVPLQQKAAELRAKMVVAGNVTDSNLIVGDKNRVTSIEVSQVSAHNAVVGTQVFNFAQPDNREANKALRLRKAYLEYLFSTLRQLSLSSIDLAASDAEAYLHLDGVYTALLTLSSEQHERGLSSLTNRVPQLSALAQLDQERYLVLVGDPGSGKSTFVNYVALCLVGEALSHQQVNLMSLTMPLPNEYGEDKDEREPWQHGALLPVRVILRDFAARGLPAPFEPITATCLWEFIEQELKAAKLDEYAKTLRETLQNEKCLLLLDGLDEVQAADARRTQVKEAITCFIRAFPHCRVLVTSRTYAYQKPEWKLPGFVEAVLVRFSEGQIRRFVSRWYAHLATQRGQNMEDAQGRARLLQQAIDNSNQLRELAERPLLLTLMASLHAWRGGNLPEKREELYAQAVDLLLYQWERQRIVRDTTGRELLQPSLAEWLKVDQNQMRHLLNQLAYEAHSSQQSVIGTADISQMRLISGLLEISPNRNIRPLQLMDYLEQRAGLLVSRGIGVYTFPHRTFQEYLAACYLAARNPTEIGELARSDPSRWREVVLLVGAKVASGSTWDVWSRVEALCYSEVEEAKESLPDIWGALLAGQMLVESVNLTEVSKPHQSKRLRVQRWQVHLLHDDTLPAVERAVAGNTLAILGDPRFLRDKWYLPNESLLGFVEIPAGPFKMGSKEQNLHAYDDEMPQREVVLPTYWLARYPVTVKQWQAFVEACGHQPHNLRSLTAVVNHPVRLITWHETKAYCEWLHEMLLKEADERLTKSVLEVQRRFWEGLQSGQLRVALPSEAEWEKAARGTDGRTYPWGEEASPERANYEKTGIGTTNSVGAFPHGASPYGCEEMSGNMWEWTRSHWKEKDPTSYKNRVVQKHKVVRGGAYHRNERLIRCAVREHTDPKDVRWGFRVAVSPFPYR